MSPFFQPAEWLPHRACWLAFPSHEDLWGDLLPQVRSEFAALCQAIADPDPVTGQCRGEQLKILVLDEVGEATARSYLGDLNPQFYQLPFGDIWLRDTAPVGLINEAGERRLLCLPFNGWGKKYQLPGDSDLAVRLALAIGLPYEAVPLFLEGGDRSGWRRNLPYHPPVSPQPQPQSLFRQRRSGSPPQARPWREQNPLD